MKEKNIFTHKFLPILGLVFFILFILLISNSYSYTEQEVVKYFNECVSYIKSNGDTFYTYAIFEDTSKTNSYWFVFTFRSNGFIGRKGNQGAYWIAGKRTYAFLYEDGVLTGDVRRNDSDYNDFYIYWNNVSYKYSNDGYHTELNTNYFYLSNTEPTFSYPQIISCEFEYNKINTYEAYISLDEVNWDTFNIEYVYLNEDGSPQENSSYIYYYNIFENGNYHIRLFDNSTGQYIYDDYINVTNLSFEIIIEPEEKTDKPIIAKTNSFVGINGEYSCYYSTDKKEWKSMNFALEEPSEDVEVVYGTNYYWTRIFKNGIYYFKFVKFIEEIENGEIINVETEEYYVTKEIKNLTIEDYMSDDYIFKPIISLDFNEEKECFIVRTQSILLDKALNLNCFYITYEKTDSFNPNDEVEDIEITSWNKMEIDFENNIFMGTSDAYFYFEIPVINAIDTNYKIAFYNYFSKKSSEIVYYDFVYEDAKNYVENDLKVHLGVSVYLNDLLKIFESKLGILGFPISVIRNFSNKILTLQLKEPVIYIPELYEPFYHNKIFNGISFNFNSLLVSDSVIFIHEFYLTIVDIIFIFLFLVFCINTLKSFIDFNK